MIGAFAIITQGLITNLCDAFFMSWLLAVPSLSALAVNPPGRKKKTDLGQILTHTHQLYREGEMGESRVKGQRGERGGNDGGGEGEQAGRGWEIDSEERKEKAHFFT